MNKEFEISDKSMSAKSKDRKDGRLNIGMLVVRVSVRVIFFKGIIVYERLIGK